MVLSTTQRVTFQDLEEYFEEPIVSTAKIREDRVTIALSPTKTEQKTIIQDLDTPSAKE